MADTMDTEEKSLPVHDLVSKPDIIVSEDEEEEDETKSYTSSSSSANSDSGSEPASEYDDYESFRSLPGFASKENRDLDRKVKHLERSLDKVTVSLSSNKHRVSILREHLKNVEQEIGHTQRVVDARRAEGATEEQLRYLAQSEADRVRAASRKLHQRREELQTETLGVEQTMFGLNDQLVNHRKALDWNQEELEQWTRAARQHEDDDEAYRKYQRADDGKTKALELALERITEQALNAKRELEQEVTETQMRQIELDKTADELQAAHAGRRQMLGQWQDAVATLKRRDDEIQRLGQVYARLATERDQVQGELDAEKRRSNELEQDRGSTDSQAASLDRALQKTKEETLHSTQALDRFDSQISLLRVEVTEAGNEVNVGKAQNAALKEQLSDMQERLEVARRALQTAKSNLIETKEHTDNAESAIRDAENLLANKEAEVKKLDKKLAACKEEKFKLSQRLHHERGREANTAAEISGAEASLKNLGTEIRRFDEQALRQQELLYTAQFQIQQMERNVSRASGVRSDAEKVKLNATIQTCQVELTRATSQHAMLGGQIKKLQEELRGTRATKEQVEKRHRHVIEVIHELELEISSAGSSMEVLHKEKEKQMVALDVLKLQAKRLRDALFSKTDKVVSLANRKEQLRLSMEERKKEIAVHEQLQRSRAKLVEEERSQLAKEAKGRELKVTKLRHKYVTICKGGAVGADGEERSQAYYVIEAAQHREELQREGDELEARFKRSKVEIKALQDTLQGMKRNNTAFRESFHKVDADSEELVELTRLQKESKSLIDATFRKKKEVDAMRSEQTYERRRVEQLQQQLDQIEADSEDLDASKTEAYAEALEQQEVAKALDKEVASKARQHRSLLRTEDASPHELRFQTEENHKTCENIMFTLNQLAKEFVDIGQHLGPLTNKYGV